MYFDDDEDFDLRAWVHDNDSDHPMYDWEEYDNDEEIDWEEL